MIRWSKAIAVSIVALLMVSSPVFSQSKALKFEKLIPLHQVKKSPKPYDWLATNDEPGQTFEDFTKSLSVKPDKEKQYIYISLLGDFDDISRDIIEKTARFIEVYYQMRVKFADLLPLSIIPKDAQRQQPITKDRQILSTFVIDEILIPRKPADAFCYIAFTTADLWPGEGWNFVFGQASLDDRVGVWSIYRNGDPQAGQSNYQLCLRRTVSTGTHEIGHMFGLHHCIYYECNLNGSNHRMESDSRPLWLCPICLRKLTHILNIDPLERYKNLATISGEFDFDVESEFYNKSWQQIETE